jgi:hypothetical protein
VNCTICCHLRKTRDAPFGKTIEFPKSTSSTNHRGKGQLKYIVSGPLLLDDLLRDNVPHAKQDGRSRALCHKWSLEEKVTGTELNWGLVEAGAED